MTTRYDSERRSGVAYRCGPMLVKRFTIKRETRGINERRNNYRKSNDFAVKLFNVFKMSR